MMKLFNSSTHDQEGFTIIELMIATTVFSLVLLLCAFGLIQIGRQFQKGVTITRTQEAARGTVEDISDTLRLGGGEYIPLDATVDNVEGFCVGSKRFSFIRNRQLVATAPNAEQSRRVLIVDELANDDVCGAGVAPQNLLTDGSVAGREMLGERMQLRELEVEPLDPVSANLYRIRIRVVTGENEFFDGNFCRSGASTSPFCATAELETIVQRRK